MGQARNLPLLDQLSVLSLATGLAFEITGNEIRALERKQQGP